MVGAIADTDEQCIISWRGGEVAGYETRGGVDRKARGAVHGPSEIRRASDGVECRRCDAAILLTSDGRGTVYGHAIRLHKKREFALGSVFRVG